MQDPTIYEDLSLEFLRGETTALLAAISDLQFVWGRIGNPELNIDVLAEAETNIVVPIGPLLQRPPPPTICTLGGYGA